MDDQERLRRRNEVAAHLDFSSGKIGELVRIITLALAALYYVFSASTSDFAQRVMAHHTPLVVLISVAGCFAIAAEWAQYLLARALAARAADLADNAAQADLWPESGLKNWQRSMFWIKQAFAAAGILALIWLMWQTIPPNGAQPKTAAKKECAVITVSNCPNTAIQIAPFSKSPATSTEPKSGK